MDRIRAYKFSEEQKAQILSVVREVLAGEDQIIFAMVYGSFVEDVPFRDIDLGIYVKDLNTGSYFDYEFDISQKVQLALESNIPIDVRIINLAPLPFKFRVVTGKLLFTRDEEVWEEFAIEVARSYMDMAPLRERYILESIS
ncbi:MAG: hypothetical protein JRH08_10590 [Deltaproteobacteria bacterium]|nr:hypothetical protein [Deltaproteobacteria bacterium]MBW2026953.1 hypothetical protein [Deltaproteobacteria bacterium]MBW2126126.1 hypothetical protein [Deltaproteobacteria bacterium]RLB20981.1 MAG: hypothetical protein DRG76_09975 [Deltaproteobacteria bacterium]